MAASASSVAYFQTHGWLYYYGDAEAHLNIARRLVDNSTPGWEQLGVPWLPLPHFLIAPFAASDTLWHNGLAGSVPAALSFVLAAVFLFEAAREVFASVWAGWIALLLFIGNPNALYLQSTAMTEPFFASALCGVLLFSVRFRRSRRVSDAVLAGVFALAGTLIRYDGWFVLPFCAMYFFLTGSSQRWRATAAFSAIAASGPLVWIFFNWWLSGDPLSFYRGSGSALAIQGNAPYPGLHNWGLARAYYRTCVQLVLGAPLFWLAIAGLIACAARRVWWPVVLLLLPPAFYVWSMHSSNSTPIFVPSLWPYSWYNSRYGLAMLPAAAFLGAALTRSRWGLALVLVAVFPWLRYPSHQNWITWKESERNSISRRAWTGAAAAFLRSRAQRGEHFAAEFDDVIGIFRAADIPLRYVFHPGNTLLWEAAARRPELFLNTAWVVCQQGDGLCLATRRDPVYAVAKEIAVPGAPKLEIYIHEYSVLQSARLEE